MRYLPISEGSPFFEQMSLFGISEFPHKAEPSKIGQFEIHGNLCFSQSYSLGVKCSERFLIPVKTSMFAL